MGKTSLVRELLRVLAERAMPQAAQTRRRP